MSDELRRKLSQVEDDLSGLREERAEKVRGRDEAKAAFAQVDGYDTDSDEYKAAAAAIKNVSEVDQRIADAQNAQVGILQMLGQEEPAAVQPSSDDHGGDAEAWDSRRVLTEENKAALARFATSTGRFGRHQLGEIASRKAMAADLGSADVVGLIQPDQRGLLAPLFRSLRLLDLIPSGTTDSNLIEYVQATKLAEEAAETAEGIAKPEASFTFDDADAPVRTIAAWIKIRKQTLADAAALQSFVDNALRYDVRRRLEAQVANGNGVGQNIRGIQRTTGVQIAAVGAGENYQDRLHHGIVDVQLADQEPSFIGLHPNDNETVRLAREGTGATSGGYLFGPPSQVGAPTIWGLPTVVSTAFTEGLGLVGDARAALVLIREGVNVLISDSDQNDFITNRVTLLAEMRAGLVVWRPDGFSKVHLTGSHS